MTALLAIVVPLAGCASWTTSVAVTRSASLDLARVARTVAVDVPPGDHPAAAAQLRVALAEIVAQGRNPSLRLALHGDVTITAMVLVDEYTEESGTTIGLAPVPSSSSPTGFDLGAVPVVETVGIARSRIRFAVLDRDGREVSTVTLRDAQRGAPSRDLLTQLRAGLVRRFGAYIEPTPSRVEVEYAGCGGDARCRRGFEAAQQQRFADAARLFTQVIGTYEAAAVPAGQRAVVADALYDRALVRTLGGDPAAARRDIDRALVLRPGAAPTPWLRGRDWIEQAGERTAAQGAP